MFVKPAAGLRVRDPYTRVHMPDEGKDVPDGDLEWHRLLIQGDIVKIDPPIAAQE